MLTNCVLFNFGEFVLINMLSVVQTVAARKMSLINTTKCHRPRPTYN